MGDSNNSAEVDPTQSVRALLLAVLGLMLISFSFPLYSSLEDDICRPSETTRCVRVGPGMRGESTESVESQRVENFFLALMPAGPGVLALVSAAGMARRHRKTSSPTPPRPVRRLTGNPRDITGQCLFADWEVAKGDVEAGLGRLLAVVQATSGSDRDRARAHLLTLFDKVGATDPRVVRARRHLENSSPTPPRPATLSGGAQRLNPSGGAVDGNPVVRRPTGNPRDIAGQCSLADREVAKGDVEAGLGRLLAVVQATSGSDRDQARAHLLTLFARVGGTDPRVIRARRALAAMLN